MTTPADTALHGLALLEVVQRSGADSLYEFGVLAGLECEHVAVALYLANVIVKITQATGYDLAALIDEQRSQALTVDEPPPGMA